MSPSASPLPSRHSSRKQSSSTLLEQHQRDGNVTVETLISWLVAAKRSLSSIHHVHRATTILSEARSIIESTAALIARTKYLKRSLNSQLKLLRGVQFEIEGAAHDVKQEIYATTTELKQAEKRLHDNISILRQTKIQRGFRSQNQLGDADDAALHDFIDDEPIIALETEIESVSSAVEQIKNHVDHSIRAFEVDLQNVNEVLADRTATSSSTRSDLQPFSISKQMRSLEIHAQEMAQSLESLVSHYDLCVSAIKRTEGAGIAIAKQISAEKLPEEVGADLNVTDQSEEPMTDDGLAEMMQVLGQDAEQVEDVAIEIAERVLSMESQLQRLQAWQEGHKSQHRDVTTAFQQMETISHQLPSYVNITAQFNHEWQAERLKIEDQLAALEDLSVTYELFLSAYDGMIVEAARRKTVRKKMEKIVADAQTQLDQLYDEDARERELFRSERGGFLPGNIWEGLNTLPSQYTWQKSTEEGINSVPDLERSVVAAALKRLKAGLEKSTER